MELINTIGTLVRVRDEHVERLIAAGYRRPDRHPRHAKAARRTTSRAGATKPAASASSP